MVRRSEIEALTPGLRRYARGLTGAAEVADDLVQDALLSALCSTGLGRGEALKRRLYAIVTDFNRMRAAALPDPDFYDETARSVVSLFAPRPADPEPREPDPLAAMTLAEREAVLLVAVEGFAYAEAADIVGASPAALIGRLARARGEPRPDVGAGFGHRHLRIVS